MMKTVLRQAVCYFLNIKNVSTRQDLFGSSNDAGNIKLKASKTEAFNFIGHAARNSRLVAASNIHLH